MTEGQEQAEVVKWFRDRWPEHAKSLRCSLNGINLGGRQKAARAISHAKTQGMVIGEADLAILLPKGGFGSLLIEHKADGQAHTVSAEQDKYLEYHNSIGNCAVSTRGIEAMKAAIAAYMEG